MSDSEENEKECRDNNLTAPAQFWTQNGYGNVSKVENVRVFVGATCVVGCRFGSGVDNEPLPAEEWTLFCGNSGEIQPIAFGAAGGWQSKSYLYCLFDSTSTLALCVFSIGS